MLTYRRPSAFRLFMLFFALVTGLTVVLGAMLAQAQARSVQQYTFTKVADSVEDGFDPVPPAAIRAGLVATLVRGGLPWPS